MERKMLTKWVAGMEWVSFILPMRYREKTISFQTNESHFRFSFMVYVIVGELVRRVSNQFYSVIFVKRTLLS